MNDRCSLPTGLAIYSFHAPLFLFVCSNSVFLSNSVAQMSVSYFIPEDGDLESQPNVFLAPKPRQPGYPPSLAEIKQSFPLPGRYHFRFKAPIVPGSDRDKGAMPVWMDVVDDRHPVHTWKSQIICKVTRIGVEDDFDDEDDDDDDEDFRRPTEASATYTSPPQQPQRPPPPSAQHQQPPPQPPKPATAPSFDLFDGPSHAPSVPTPPVHTTGDLLGGHAHNPAPASGGSLLDMDFHNHPNPSQQQQQHSDFIGMTTAPSPPVSGNFNHLYSNTNVSFQRQQQPPPPSQARPMQQTNNHKSAGSFDSFGNTASNGNGGGGAFGGLGTPWKT
jgi:hypothetical protein